LASGIPDALAPLGVASRRDGYLQVCSVMEGTIDPIHRPEGYLPIPPAGSIARDCPPPEGAERRSIRSGV